LSSLSVLSEIPILVKKLFITNKYQENGNLDAIILIRVIWDLFMS